MSAWGKYDDKTSAGTISIASDGVVTGVGTNFNPELGVGDFIKTGSDNLLVDTVTCRASVLAEQCHHSFGV